MTETMPNHLTDLLPTRESLLARLKDSDDQQGWQEFFDSYWKLIYGVAIKSGLSDAEAQDAVQETVIVVSKHIGEFKYDPAKCSFKTWLLLITRQRIGRQFARRQKDTLKRELQPEDGPRTGTIERVADPAGIDLEAVWDDEWHKHLLATAAERVKRKVDPEHYQIFDLYVLQQWPLREVTRTLGVTAARVYLVKHRIGRLLKKEVHRLQKQMR